MSKIYKYLYIVILSLFIATSFKSVSVKADADAEEREKLIVCDATLNDDFLDDSVIIVLKIIFHYSLMNIIVMILTKLIVQKLMI